MKKRTKLITAGSLALVALGVTAGAVTAQSGDSDGERQSPITGAARARAEHVALTTVGSGRVTATEAGDEEGYYQVEVTKDDGSQVDVNMDKSFNVVKTKAEHETNDDAGG